MACPISDWGAERLATIASEWLCGSILPLAPERFVRGNRLWIHLAGGEKIWDEWHYCVLRIPLALFQLGRAWGISALQVGSSKIMEADAYRPDPGG
jgi:hypothetical protein